MTFFDDLTLTTIGVEDGDIRLRHGGSGPPNTLICPHLGYVTEESYRAFYSGIIENVRAFTSGEPVRVINSDVLTSSQFRGYE